MAESSELELQLQKELSEAEELLKEATAVERPAALRRYRRALERFADLVVRDVPPADLGPKKPTAQNSASAKARGGQENQS